MKVKWIKPITMSMWFTCQSMYLSGGNVLLYHNAISEIENNLFYTTESLVSISMMFCDNIFVTLNCNIHLILFIVISWVLLVLTFNS